VQGDSLNQKYLALREQSSFVQGDSLKQKYLALKNQYGGTKIKSRLSGFVASFPTVREADLSEYSQLLTSADFQLLHGFTYLDLSNIQLQPFMFTELARITTLKTLILKNCGIDTVNIPNLIITLTALVNLEELSLKNNKFGILPPIPLMPRAITPNAIIIPLIQSLPNSLKFLDLKDTELNTNLHILSIAMILKTKPNFNELLIGNEPTSISLPFKNTHFEGNGKNITDSCISILGNALIALDNIKHIDLRNNPFNTINNLKQAIINLPDERSIDILDLRNTNRVEEILSLGGTFNKIKSLYLGRDAGFVINSNINLDLSNQNIDDIDLNIISLYLRSINQIPGRIRPIINRINLSSNRISGNNNSIRNLANALSFLIDLITLDIQNNVILYDINLLVRACLRIPLDSNLSIREIKTLRRPKIELIINNLDIILNELSTKKLVRGS
jgi:hypothetical protein